MNHRLIDPADIVFLRREFLCNIVPKLWTRAMRSEYRQSNRRQFLRSAVGASLAATFPLRASGARKTLRIMRWKNFVPKYEDWFNEVFLEKWGNENNTDVIVDNVGIGEIKELAAQEAKSGQGHDLVLFVASRPTLEDYVIDHRDIIEECTQKFGAPLAFTLNSCFNPKTGKYHGFCESYAPTVLTYRKDLWDQLGYAPDSWDRILKGGRAIRYLSGNPVGISLAPEHNSEHSLRALMAAFGAYVQDQVGNVVIRSVNTLDALGFLKSLYEDAMTPEVLSWNPANNNQFMLSGKGSLTMDTMSIIRAAESKSLPVDRNLALAALPEGSNGSMGPSFSANTYVIWKFAQNIEGAKKFLVDYTASFRDGFMASGFQNMPSFPGAVPDISDLLNQEERYSVLSQVPATMTNFGAPGNSNAATDEVRSKGIIPMMFARVATGESGAEESLDLAEKEIIHVFDKWRQAGKI